MRFVRELIVPVLLAAATACGQVESGVCAGEDTDDIACTVDICDAESAAWAHIPDDNLCEVGQRCDPTAGCVAASALTGVATLLGKGDHSGITVTIEGVEGGSTMTDAMGKWSLTVPAGTYRVSYSKDKYITQLSDDLIVTKAASEVAPSVELAHGEELGSDRVISANYGAFANPDKSYIIETVNSGFGTTYYATPADGSTPPVLVVASPQSIQFTNTHAVWRQGNIVFSRPLNGSTPAVNLTSNLTGGTIDFIGTPGTYTLIRRNRTLPNYTETSLYVAKTDGSQLAGAAIWTQPDKDHPFNDVVTNDGFALVAFNNNSNVSGPPGDALANKPLMRIDFAAGTATALDVGYAVNQAYLDYVSPDASRVFGYFYQNPGSGYWYRGFIGNISSGSMTLASNPGFTAGSGVYQDFPYNIATWLPDNTFMFASRLWYNGSAYYGGEGRVWLPNGTIASIWPTDINYWSCYQAFPLNGAVVWRELCANLQLKVSSVSASPSTYTLDGTNMISGIWTKQGTGATGSYIAWAETPPGTSLPNKVFGANIAVNLPSAPTPVQLGPSVPTNCSWEGTLSGTTFFQLCGETGTLTAYPAASSTASGTLTGVQGGLTPLVAADRFAFRKVDGHIYTAANTGALAADVVPLATHVDGNTGLQNVGNWVFYKDSSSLLTRVSKADGSAIDEPLSNCDMVSSGALWLNPAGTHLISTSSRCQTIDYGLTHTPTANLP